ncbi:hypothetical protein ABTN61_20020, partial [Acinetobacter baumannii]
MLAALGGALDAFAHSLDVRAASPDEREPAANGASVALASWAPATVLVADAPASAAPADRSAPAVEASAAAVIKPAGY